MKNKIKLKTTLDSANIIFPFIWKEAKIFGISTLLCSLLVSIIDVLCITLLATFLNEEISSLKGLYFLSWINNANLLTVFFVLLLSLFLRLILQLSIDLTSAKVSSAISRELYFSHFTRNYISLKESNKSKFITLATSYINSTSASSIDVLNAISYSFNVLITISVVVMIGGWLTFYILGSTLLVYTSYILFTKKYISRFSKKAAQLSLEACSQCVNDSNIYKRILLDGNQKFKSYKFSEIVFKERFFIQFTRFLANSIKPTIETSFLILILTITSFDKQSGNLGVIISICYGILRALPGINTVYSSYIGLKTGHPKLLELFKVINIEKTDLAKYGKPSKASYKNNKYLGEIKLENINHNYLHKNSKSKKFSLKCNLRLETKNKYLLIGDSGSGKSTLIDIIMGLIRPSRGEVFFQKINVFSNESILINYRKYFSHISQDNFIVEKNISEFFNFKDLSNNKKSIIQSLAIQFELIDKKNEFHNWLTKDLGENGSTLSGGQRQRLNIIRILIEDKPFIIFDEATSALDSSMDKKVIKKILDYSENKFVIMITHRPENVEIDRINKFIKITNSKKNEYEKEAVEFLNQANNL